MQKGLSTFLFGKLTENESTGAATYATPEKLAGAIECKVTFNKNNATVYSDNVLKASDYSVSNGTISLGVDNADDSIFGPLLGATKSEESDEWVYTSNDSAEFVGFGYILMKEEGYKAVFFSKVKFQPFSEDGKTKADKIEYVTPTVEGEFSTLSNGEYQRVQTFATEAEAKTYLTSCFKAA